MSDAAAGGVIADLESEVRSYCRSWPAVFSRARGARLWDADDREYIDFFAGAGALNYGHNDTRLVRPLVDYLLNDGILHSLDMTTAAKVAFLERFRDVVLAPRGLDYKVQFPGPTGANAVEAALKLARKVSGRSTIVGFDNAFHGVTLGALALTSNPAKRAAAGLPLIGALSLPYDGTPEEGTLPDGGDSIAQLEAVLTRTSGNDRPGGVIVETVQAEGGVNVASDDWLRRLADCCRRHDLLLLVDDIQVGCGRTGPFFSFERAGITPDIVCLSKSISGAGLPFALVLMRPHLDVWAPGEHNGTFRGNNAAFVTATAALDYWTDDALSADVVRKGDLVSDALSGLRERHPEAFRAVRGVGLIHGLVCVRPELAGRIASAAFERGLLVETAGPEDEVVKLLPPLTIDDAALGLGLERLAEAAEAALGATSGSATPAQA